MLIVVAVYQSHKLKGGKSFKIAGEILKFLVIGKAIDYGGPVNPADFVMISENIILPSLQMLAEWEEKKTVAGGLFAGQRAGAIIIEASSAEDLSVWLHRLPFWAQNTWEVIPLQTFQSGTEDLKQQIVKLKQMIEMISMPK